MPEPVRTWRTRPIEVQAIRWLGEKNCEETFAFIGWEHPDDELDHSHIVGLGLDGSQEAKPGDWIVRDEDGVYEVFSDTAFRAEFEAVPTPPERPTLREVTQSFLADNEKGIPGDCLRAAVASLLDRQDTSVPHFIAGDIDGRVWWYALKGWAADNGWAVSRRELLPRQDNVPLPSFGIACGPSERGVSHAVVAVGGRVVWDPHPSRAGILRVKEAIEFAPIPYRTFTWGESVGMSGGTIDIPLNNSTGTWAATLLVERKGAEVLRDMLTEALEECEAGDD